MTRKGQIVLLLFAAIVALAGGAWLASSLVAPDRPAQGGADALLALSLPDLDDRQRTLSEWKGKVLVVNFWATWCAPCRAEVPAFVRLQDKYGAQGVQFVGIAIDEKAKVAAFADELGMNYPVLLGSIAAMDLSRKAGNRVGALPFTVVFDRAGTIVHTELGEAKEAHLAPILAKLL